MLCAWSLKFQSRLAGLVWDEIEIRNGLLFNPGTKEVYGFAKKAIPEKEVDSIQLDSVRDHTATHVLQVFLVTCDARVSLPLGFVPSKGLTGDQVRVPLKRKTKG